MKDFFKKISLPVIVAILLQLIFMVAIGVSIYKIIGESNEANYINIDNYNIISDSKTEQEITEFYKDSFVETSIESTLYDLVFMNNLSSVPNSGAKIREGSVHSIYMDETDSQLLNFVVDLENLQQSYRIVYIFTNEDAGYDMRVNDSPVVAFCLDDDELIYGDFDCIDDYGWHGKDLVMYTLLRNKRFDNFTIGLPDDLGIGDPLSIDMFIVSGDEAIKNEAISEISDFISDAGFDLEDFEYILDYQDQD